MHDVNKDLCKLLCRTCGNLNYWDGYYCELGKHNTKKELLSIRPLNKCDSYIKRKGNNWDACREQEDCIFWCINCPALNNGIKK